MSGRFSADLLVLQVVPPEHLTGQDGDGAIQAAADDLAALTRRVGGERGRPLLVCDSDPAEAIVRTCQAERADLVVVGNVGMRDRTEFLLGSVPNRVSHNARCSVVIVNTAPAGGPDGTTRPRAAQAGAEPGEPGEPAEPTEGQLLGRIKIAVSANEMAKLIDDLAAVGRLEEPDKVLRRETGRRMF